MTQHLLPNKLPDEVKEYIQNFIPRKKDNVGAWFPPLKIMETEDVTKWVSFIFGEALFHENGQETFLPLIERIEQKGEYQILHFRENLSWHYHTEYMDDFYVGLDIHGSVWIPRVTEEEYEIGMNAREEYRQPIESGIECYNRPTKGCWQIQYAVHNTPKRITDHPNTLYEPRYKFTRISYDDIWFQDGVKMKESHKGYVFSGPRPKTALTPFMPGEPNSIHSSQSQSPDPIPPTKPQVKTRRNKDRMFAKPQGKPRRNKDRMFTKDYKVKSKVLGTKI